MPIIGEDTEKFHLSHEEEDKLNEFQAITNFPEDELNMIIKHLKNHSWNLEAALSRYFDGNWKENLFKTSTPPPTTNSNQESTNSVINNPIMSNNNFGSTNVAPATTVRNTVSLIPKLPIVYALPINFKDKFQMVGLNSSKMVNNSNKISNNNIWLNQIWVILLLLPNTLFKVLQYIWLLISGNRNFANHNKGNNKIMKIPRSPTHDEYNIESNLKSLIADESKLKNILEIIKDRKPFNESLQKCKDEFKFFLVILLGNIDQDSGSPLESTTKESDSQEISKASANSSVDINSVNFIKHILTDNGVLKILDDYKDDMIVYIGDVNEIEPWSICKKVLNVKYTPECFLIGNVLNSMGSVNGITRLSVLNKLKITTPKKFQNSIKMTIEKFNPELIISRNEQKEIKLARQIKDAQELAFNESLMKDKLKDEQTRLEKLKQRNLKLHGLMDKLTWCNKSIDLIKWKLDNTNLNAGSDKDAAILQIRNSNGERFISKFQNDLTLHELYCHVGCHIFLSQFNNRFDKDVWIKALIDNITTISEVNDNITDNQDGVWEIKNDLAGLLQDMDPSNIISHKQDKISVLIGKIQDLLGKTNSRFEFNFELVSPFPRYVLNPDEVVTLGEVPQVYPKGSLLVEEVVDLEDTSESDPDSE